MDLGKKRAVSEKEGKARTSTALFFRFPLSAFGLRLARRNCTRACAEQQACVVRRCWSSFYCLST